MQAAFAQRTRAIGNAAAAFKSFADFGVGFETLEFFKRRHIRVLVIQPHHKAHGNLVVIKVIDKRAAISLAVERPAHAVYH